MKKKQEKQGLFYRSFSIETRAIDEKKRSVELSFSSEVPAYPSRYSTIPEILLHGQDNVDLSYLKDTGSVLLNHQPNGPGQPMAIVGKPTNVRIEDRRGIATIIFDDDEESEKAFKKVLSGSLRGVSVGASIKNTMEVMAGESHEGIEGPAYIATRWTPVEISLTPIPVDASVGVSRSLSDIKQKSLTEETTMKPEEVKAMIDESLGKMEFAKPEDIPKAEDIATAVRAMITEDSKPKMQIDNETLIDISGRAGAISEKCKLKVMDLAMEGKTEPELLRAITDMAVENPDALDTGDLEGDGTGKTKRKITSRSTVTTFEGLEDKDFLGALKNPVVSYA